MGTIAARCLAEEGFARVRNIKRNAAGARVERLCPATTPQPSCKTAAVIGVIHPVVKLHEVTKGIPVPSAAGCIDPCIVLAISTVSETGTVSRHGGSPCSASELNDTRDRAGKRGKKRTWGRNVGASVASACDSDDHCEQSEVGGDHQDFLSGCIHKLHKHKSNCLHHLPESEQQNSTSRIDFPHPNPK
eukprot:751878-Hanusia_phi.AAC.3